jgi:DNA-binding response OmpR family regulator
MSSATQDIPGSTRRLLMVEDEAIIASPLMRGLEEEGYHVDLATDGAEGLKRALSETYDVLVVDWRLPVMDGRMLVARLRSAGLTVPVLMLTAMRDVDHRVAGLDAGADDYLTKPFSFEELLARLRALVRRLPDLRHSPELQTVHMHLGALEMDAARRQFIYGGVSLDLRTKEYRFLEVLMRHAGEVVTRAVLAERVWGSAFDVTDNAIDVTASGVRQRLSEASRTGVRTGDSGIVLETIRGVGYRLKPAS